MARLGPDKGDLSHDTRSRLVCSAVFEGMLTYQIAMAIELNYMLSTTLVKVSILCFYRRIGDRLTNQFIYCK